MAKKQWLTITQRIENNGVFFIIKCTQRLSEHGAKGIKVFGHYNGYIENSNGHVIHAFFSTSAPKNRITVNDVTDIFGTFIRHAGSEIANTNVVASKSEEEFEL